jgi:hypothetical protein
VVGSCVCSPLGFTRGELCLVHGNVLGDPSVCFFLLLSTLGHALLASPLVES